MIRQALQLLVLVFIVCCKTQIRDAKQLEKIVLNIGDAGLLDFNRQSLPVLVCGQNDKQVLVFGEWYDNKKLSFSLEDTGIVKDDKLCFVDVYSNQIDGLTLKYDNVKFINGEEYRLVFQSNELPLKNIARSVFKKGFEKKITNNLLYTIKFRGDLNNLNSTLDLYCQETKNVRLTIKQSNLFQAEIYEEHIIVNSNELSNCILKNNSNELTIKLLEVKSSLAIIKSKDTEVELSSLNVASLLDNAGKLTRAPSWLVGKQFKHKNTDGCEYFLGFTLDGESYSTGRKSGDGCLLPPYLENGNAVAFYISHPELKQSLNQNRVLTVFDSGSVVTYSIIERQSSGLFRVGAYVTRPQYLNSISVGLNYVLYD